MKQEIYTIMKSEMTRRKIAFSQLLISFYISIFILSFQPIISFPEISFPCFTLLAAVFGILILIVNKMLTKQAGWQFHLTEQKIIKNNGTEDESYLLKDITSIRIKRNCRGNIREMRFRTSGTSTFYINGLKDFENFHDNVLTSVKDVNIVNYKEPPVDYDHWLFYLFLGPVLGVTATFFFRLMISAGDEFFNYILYMIACYAMILGIFFFICRPVKGRYGVKVKNADIVCGLLLLIIGLLLLLI